MDRVFFSKQNIHVGFHYGPNNIQIVQYICCGSFIPFIQWVIPEKKNTPPSQDRSDDKLEILAREVVDGLVNLEGSWKSVWEEGSSGLGNPVRERGEVKNMK